MSNLEIILLIISAFLILCSILIAINYKKQNKLIYKLKMNNYKLENDIEYYKRENNRTNQQLEELKKKEYDNFRKNTKMKIKNTFCGKKVLVGDYDMIRMNNTKNILFSLGFTVDTVKTGEDIVDKITNGYKCDVILTNNLYNHSKLNSTDVLIKLKKNPDFNIPVVVLTSNFDQKSDFINWWGFDGCLFKELTQEQVEREMNSLFAKNQVIS